MIATKGMLFDFSSEVELGSDIVTEYLGKSLILKNVMSYEGPMTMQYLPYGGIQSIFHGQLIVCVKGGFITPTTIVYDEKEYTNAEFTSKFPNLVNQVLPC